MNKEAEVWPDGWSREQIYVAENLIMFSDRIYSYEERKRYVVNQLNHLNKKKDANICE